MIYILLDWVFNLGVCHSLLGLCRVILIIFWGFYFALFCFGILGILLLLNLIQILHTEHFVEHWMGRFNIANLFIILILWVLIILEGVLLGLNVITWRLLHPEVWRRIIVTYLSHELLLKHVQLWHLMIHLLLLVQNLTFKILQVTVLILVVLLASLVVQILLNLVDDRHELFVLVILREPVLLGRCWLLRFRVVEQLVQLMVDHRVQLVVWKDANSILLQLLLDEYVRLVVTIVKYRFLLILLHDSHARGHRLFWLLSLGGALREIWKAWHPSLGDKGSFSDALSRFFPAKLLNDIIQGLLILLLFSKAEEIVCCSGIWSGLMLLRDWGATLDVHLNFLLADSYVHWSPVQGWSQLDALC